ncbi:hypothetical protein BRADI_1g38783v3 [Brachypodium distachyon]|uniref:Uncharacterized protein n=1 Tax=Brachypodium distachyon TaxID=15368 RepID=A0A2K2DNH8_BRADI|nr:hypothetical protein BRADI_1g38783v3 [Brachypodium distachyon]
MPHLYSREAENTSLSVVGLRGHRPPFASANDTPAPKLTPTRRRSAYSGTPFQTRGKLASPTSRRGPPPPEVRGQGTRTGHLRVRVAREEKGA